MWFPSTERLSIGHREGRGAAAAAGAGAGVADFFCPPRVCAGAGNAHTATIRSHFISLLTDVAAAGMVPPLLSPHRCHDALNHPVHRLPAMPVPHEHDVVLRVDPNCI